MDDYDSTTVRIFVMDKKIIAQQQRKAEEETGRRPAAQEIIHDLFSRALGRYAP